MEKFDKEDSHESAADRSIHHPATEGGDEIDLNVSPEHHAFGDEGKRSPSSNKGDDVGFPSFRIGEGRRSRSSFSLSKSEQNETRSSSPSPVSLSKSEQGEILSSSPVVLASSHSTVEDNNEGRGNPSVADVQHEGSSSSSAHVENGFEQAVREQKTHSMICPVCKSDITKRIILKRKRTLVPEDDERLPEDDVGLPQPVMPEREGLDHDEAWGCLGCLSLFIRRRVVPGAEGELIGTEQEEVQCLPLPSRWRPWTSEPELNEPLLSDTAEDDPRPPEDAEEKRSWNCLPELLPAFTSWGPIPVYDVEFSLDKEESPGALSSDQENISAAEGQEEATSGSPEGEISEPIPVGAGHISDVPLDVPPVTPEPPSQDAEEETNWNCLPELLPAFSWGPIPVYDVQYSVDNDKSPGVLSSDQENITVVEGQQEATGGSPTTSLTKEPESVGDTGENGSWNCLPELPPASSSGKIPVVDNTYLPHSTSGDDNSERPASLSETPAYSIARVPGSSAVHFNEGSHTTGSEDLHIEGTVTSHKTDTITDPTEQPTEVNVVESNYHFEVGILDGHFTSTVEKLPPKLPELEISNGEADSSTVAESSVSSAISSDGPEQAHVPGDLEGTGAEISEEHLGQHRPEAIAAQPNQENMVTLDGIVPKPITTFLSHIFPPVEIEDETEAKETGEQKPKLENDWCTCLPVSVKPTRWWRPSMDDKVEEGLEEHLLDKVEENEGGTSTDTSVPPRRDLTTDRTGERCSCLPALPKFSMYDVFRDHNISPGAPLPGTTPPKTETVVNIVQKVDQTVTNVTAAGPTTEGAADEAVSIAQGERPSESAGSSQEYLKSIVHGGLDVTLVSLGVVASGAGADAKTITVIAIGLANLVFGLIKHLNNIMSLYYNNRPKFVEDIGQGFLHGCLSFISFLFFGALAPITYGFSFRNATNRDYKIASTCVVALVCIVLLGAAQAHVNSKSAVRVISRRIVSGFVAVTAGYGTGNYVGQLLEYFEFFSV